MTEQAAKTVRCVVEVTAGVIPGTPEPDFNRRFFITSEEWHAGDGINQTHLLTDLAGKASAYSMYLMLQPDRLNWVKVEWIWL